MPQADGTLPPPLDHAELEELNAAKRDRLVQVYPPEVAAARAAHRERRRKVHEEQLRPPTPQEAREQTRRAVMDTIGCLMPIPAVAAVAGVAVVVAGEAIPVALVATVAGTITGLLMILVMYFVVQEMDARGVEWDLSDWAEAYLPFAAAVRVTLLVSRIL